MEEETIFTLYENGEIKTREKMDFQFSEIFRDLSKSERVEFTKKLKLFFIEIEKFDLEVDSIFYISQFGETGGFMEYSSTFLQIDSHSNLKMFFETEESENEFEKLIYNFFTTSSEKYILKRKEEDFSELKKISFATLLIIILSATFPIYNFYKIEILRENFEKLSTNYSTLKNENFEKVSFLAQFRDTEFDLDIQIEKLRNEQNQILKNLENLEFQKEEYSQKSKTISEIAILMSEHSVFTNSIFFENGFFRLEIFSEKSKNVANFLNELSSNFTINYNSIEFVEKENIFKVKISIKI
ncbi:hypothetical protein ThvES_00004820 [Thiovulum sp. ES]|nr:hypothetical protein ThvES_00004820 [Thiovulum sp. ES]